MCFSRSGPAGEKAWAAAALTRGPRLVEAAVVSGVTSVPYEPGLLALREGPVLQEALDALGGDPEVVLVNATGRDHPRRAGLALHLGAVVGLPTVGVTDRPLLASGPDPAGDKGSASPLELEGEVVGHLLRTRRGARPIATHAAWRTDPEVAVQVVMACVRRARTPEPLFSIHPPGNELVVWATAPEAAMITSPPNASQNERVNMDILRIADEPGCRRTKTKGQP